MGGKYSNRLRPKWVDARVIDKYTDPGLEPRKAKVAKPKNMWVGKTPKEIISEIVRLENEIKRLQEHARDKLMTARAKGSTIDVSAQASTGHHDALKLKGVQRNLIGLLPPHMWIEVEELLRRQSKPKLK